ncbi:peptide-methionine (R)-S-oxide reductase MsrB [Aquirhabdus parva]|uniref:Peptide methionine sulfoxide reductase MsrB n=1 Tax=Aquirhabdus parva TaxID=2283318 RepID=A0A345P5F0_9GAMM|nr:peptide-methionine (R)-S-oxide reductase MsrB [Aquirhabdus parva]AXI02509.1 peptide-methionine (R)-S-oxide reductase [Aquirhabdus parva]
MAIQKTEQEWKQELSPEDFHILREKGTEPAFTGIYWDNHAAGIYRCKACNVELFESTSKYDSGCGWPSFTRPFDEHVIDEHEDLSFGRVRTEVTCHNCGGHLGHVFPDGPQDQGGLRYCINSASIKLDEEK